MRTFCCSMVMATAFCYWHSVQTAFAQNGGKGIGRIVSEAAKSGLRGQALADEIKRLQAAHGIGRINGGGPPGKGRGARGGGPPAGKGRGAKGGGPPAGKGRGAKGGGPRLAGGPFDEVDVVERELEGFIESNERRREALLEALETAPNSAKPGIRRAIDASNGALKDSRELLGRLRERDGGPGAQGGGPPAGKGPGAKGGGPPAGKGRGAKGGGPPAGNGRGAKGGRAF